MPLEVESDLVREPSMHQCYRARHPEHPDATISYEEESVVVLGLDLDSKVVFFDWLQVMTQVFEEEKTVLCGILWRRHVVRHGWCVVS